MESSINTPKSPTPAVYFQSLTLENVKCFTNKQTIDLSDGNGNYAPWTVILGNNNTGKTTILKALIEDEPQPLPMNETTENNVSFNTFNILNDYGDILKYYDRKTAIKMNVNLKDTEIFFEIHSYVKKDSSQTYSQIIESDKYDIDTKNNIRKYNEKQRLYNNIITGGKSKLMGHILDTFKVKVFVSSYGATRRMSRSLNLMENYNSNHINDLFNSIELMNAEEWLSQLYLNGTINESIEKIYEMIKKLLSSGLLPDVKDIRIVPIRVSHTVVSNNLECLTDYGWVKIRDMGFGYQAMMGWVMDLVRRMIDRYPTSENPLAEPAVVLVDEIDLHLHPEWQRKIIAHLSKHFPRTQFIVTVHSPLIVQSAENINIVMLHKEGDHVTIRQHPRHDFRGWTIEEILTQLMEVDSAQSQEYLRLIRAFEDAIEEERGEDAHNAYEALAAMMNPSNWLLAKMKIELAQFGGVAA